MLAEGWGGCGSSFSFIKLPLAFRAGLCSVLSGPAPAHLLFSRSDKQRVAPLCCQDCPPPRCPGLPPPELHWVWAPPAFAQGREQEREAGFCRDPSATSAGRQVVEGISRLEEPKVGLSISNSFSVALRGPRKLPAAGGEERRPRSPGAVPSGCRGRAAAPRAGLQAQPPARPRARRGARLPGPCARVPTLALCPHSNSTALGGLRELCERARRTAAPGF